MRQSFLQILNPYASLVILSLLLAAHVDAQVSGQQAGAPANTQAAGSVEKEKDRAAANPSGDIGATDTAHNGSAARNRQRQMRPDQPRHRLTLCQLSNWKPNSRRSRLGANTGLGPCTWRHTIGIGNCLLSTTRRSESAICFKW